MVGNDLYYSIFYAKKGQINMKKTYLETFNSLIMEDIQFSFFIRRHIIKKFHRIEIKKKTLWI